MDFELNLSEEEFERSMKEIDERLVSEQVKVPARELRGWMLFCEKRQLSGISLNHSISTKVLDWFKARYGDRLNLDFCLGHSVELIRGDLFRSCCNVFYGRLQLVCHPALMGHSTTGPVISRPALVNTLDQMKGMTTSFAASLTSKELETLLRGYAISLLHLSRIGDLTKQPFVLEARADLRESVEHMFHHEAQYGLSKWSSLQAVEKFLKAFIVQQGTQPKHGRHILTEFADAAEACGLLKIPRELLARAQCSASARYESASVSREEAIESYRAAVEIAGGIALQLTAKSGWRTEIYGQYLWTVPGLKEKIPMVAIRRVKVRSSLEQPAPNVASSA
jgi:hypothetical protein